MSARRAGPRGTGAKRGGNGGAPPEQQSLFGPPAAEPVNESSPEPVEDAPVKPAPGPAEPEPLKEAAPPAKASAPPAGAPAKAGRSVSVTGDAAPLADEDARRQIREDLDSTLIVEAAAGTGKTTVLIERMLAALRSGRAALDGMVAVTFTDAAAGEMKLRLRTAIERARLDDATPVVEKQRLGEALPKLEEARIGTIHSFCADLLREHPVEARVDPLFEVAADDAATQLLDRAFDRWFERQLGAPGPGVRRVLRRPPQRRGPGRRRNEGPREVLRQAAETLVWQRDYPAPWKRLDGFDRDREIDAILDDMESLAPWAARGEVDDWFTKSLAEISRFAAEVKRTESLRGRDYDDLEARLIGFGPRRTRNRFWNWKGRSRAPRDFPRQELLERRDALRDRLSAFSDLAGADLAPRLRDDLWPVVEEYEQLKTQAGRLDFLDLLARARDLVRDDAGVRASLQDRFTHLFVDEFQDTDPLQAEILLLIAADDPKQSNWLRVRPVPGKLFIVGDPKQSIYRFRRADVALYEGIKQRVLKVGASLVHLNVSFRSVPEVQETVNAAFAPRMRGETPSQPEYVPLMPFRASHPGQPAVVALPVPKPYSDWGKVTEWRIEESLPDAVAAFVEWLVRDSGWTVTEQGRPGERVPLQARHVCLLFRRFKSFFDDVTRPYAIALEARRLPHLLVGGSSFHEREEVETLRNALGAIERPDDELTVYATLRGPLFSLSDEALLVWRIRVGALHPFRHPPEDLSDDLGAVAEALAVLRELHRGRNRRPVADTIGRLLAATRAHAGIAIWPTGEQSLANVARLVDLARRAERGTITSFRAFVDWLEDQAERGEAGNAPVFEEGTEGVRIMTVHRAKGLEFPVVILADLTANETPRDPGRWVDPERGLCAVRLAGAAPPDLLDNAPEELNREREEAARVLYVASTRARDLLVVPAVGDERHAGWLSILDRAIYPPIAGARRPETRHPEGCPEFGTDSVLERPNDADPPIGSIAPGLHRPEAGAHHVVWWDPHVLNLGVQETVGVAQQRILAVDRDGARSDESVRAHEAWRERGARVRGEAERAALEVTAATAFAGAAEAETGAPPADLGFDPAQVVVESAGEVASDRPRGVRFGSLVHALFAVAGLDDPPDAIAAHARLQARLLGATGAEETAATGAVTRALAHPLLRRAAEAARTGRCRRETPILRRMADGTLIECVADLVFMEDGEGGTNRKSARPASGSWTVVDFKTDAEIGVQLDRYRRQVALYAGGIAEASGLDVRAVLLRV